MQHQKFTPPSHIIALNEQIQCFQLAGHESCQNLVGIAVEGKILLGIVRFPVFILCFWRNFHFIINP